jgi:A/G-specific adenine glycosylase
MLQQTRVETVKAYYESWHSRWPTIEDLALASPEDVLSAWRGLGYYSRATRIHDAAKKITSDPTLDGLLPELPADLETKVPGVGRYTAGAISSIVFGHAVPLLDGNVSRVLCRQMGLFADVKNKKITDILWESAEQLVQAASANVLVKRGINCDPINLPKSDVPSFWNQAMMEIGSTLCKPLKPACNQCPIQKTCKSYAEGEWLADSRRKLKGESSSVTSDRTSKVETMDIEDLCSLCGDLDLSSIQTEKRSVHDSTAGREKGGLKQSTLSFNFAGPAKSKIEEPRNKEGVKVAGQSGSDTTEVAAQYASLFPMRVAKKVARDEECIVCIIQRTDKYEPSWMIEQRPNKGLLANLWQFPSQTISSDESATHDLEIESSSIDQDAFVPLSKRKSIAQSAGQKLSLGNQRSTKLHSGTAPAVLTPSERKSTAIQFAHSVLQGSEEIPKSNTRTDQSWKINCVKEHGSITHPFSHIKLVMHVYHFSVVPLGKLEHDEPGEGVRPNSQKSMEYQQRKWGSRAAVEDANFGTGMRRCWALTQ